MTPGQLLDRQQDLHDFVCLVIFCIGVFAATVVAIYSMSRDTGK